MAKTVNKVILVGRLGADPDVRYTQDGNPIVNFNLATNEPVRTNEGNWEERAEWHRVVVFRRLAELCANYLGKGQMVYIEGKLRTRQWEDNQGVKRYTTEVVARDVVFLGGRQEQGGQASPPYSNYGSGPAPRPAPAAPARQEGPLPDLPAPPETADPDDDIPF